jgi:GNAT superfamily N-acetyltransferase
VTLDPVWHIRPARREDVGAVAAAVAALLEELGAKPPALASLHAATRALIDGETNGVLLVAEAGAELVGALAVSWQSAIHIPGRYALIQDLWVAPSWRSRKVGQALLAALVELVGEQGATRIEVGLPRESFASLTATEAFYRREGFTPLGSRMRRALQ